MDLQSDPIAIIGSSCRLPGNITSTEDLWPLLLNGLWEGCSTSAPATRGMSLIPGVDVQVKRAGWLPSEGVEDFDAAFFRLTPGEAETLRPNARLSLELTWEALENAGIPPSQLKGKNVAVSVAMGTEDGWDLRRYSEEGGAAFDHNWAQNSDPSAVPGRIAHFFDFRGPAVAVSGACASGVSALDSGIHALLSQDADVAIVGGITTHFSPGALQWASKVKVASQRGRCSAFSADADGYVPSEGAVFMVLERSSRASAFRHTVDCVIRSLTLRHNGNTRTLTSPSVVAQKEVMKTGLTAAGLTPKDIILVEAHGTGTVLGDMIEMEAIQDVFLGHRSQPLIVSSSKSVLGHCQAAAALVGILKIILCIKHKQIPPHHVDPQPQYKAGHVRVPTTSITLDESRGFAASLSSLGFTGVAANVILADGPHNATTKSCMPGPYLLPFSATTSTALQIYIDVVRAWIKSNPISLTELAAVLSIRREHHTVRHAIVVHHIDDVERHFSGSSWTTFPRAADDESRTTSLALLNLDAITIQLPRLDADEMQLCLREHRVLDAAVVLYQCGHALAFDDYYSGVSVSRETLRSFPGHPFVRKRCWRYGIPDVQLVSYKPQAVLRQNSLPDHSGTPQADDTDSSRRTVVTAQAVADVVCSVLQMKPGALDFERNIFDAGIDSLNSIELAQSLSYLSKEAIEPGDMYRLLNVKAIAAFLSGGDTRPAKPSPQAEVDELLEEFSTPLSTWNEAKEMSTGPKTVLLTGSTGFLGSQLLSKLLALPAINLICLVRGDGGSRLRSAWDQRGLDLSTLDTALFSGRLRLFSTLDLGMDHLGCSEESYESIRMEVDVVVHGAWKVDFNFRASGFRPDLYAVRNLAQLCASANKYADLHFISSISTVFGCQADTVPETPLPPDVNLTLDQGYAHSKLVAEHMLYRLQSHNIRMFGVRIVRVGQICGHSATGGWTPEEMLPSLMASLPTLKSMPANLPDPSWIPVDVCASTLCDLVAWDLEQRTGSAVAVYNVANPRVTRWEEAVQIMAQYAGCTSAKLLLLSGYVRRIQSAQSALGNVPVHRLLPYFKDVIANDDFPQRYCTLDISGTMNISSSLANCQPIDAGFIALLMERVISDTNLPSSRILLQSPSTSSNVVNRQFVLLFGPWSGPVPEEPSNYEFFDTLDRLRAFAAYTCPEAGINQQSQVESTHKLNALDRQLKTLAYQLSNVARLRRHDVHPHIVLGYCFGEFAAAVASGALSERSAVEVIVRRALAVEKAFAERQDSDGGAMLNVFADAHTVRVRLLLLGRNAAEIAIYAGPAHVVLSGTSRTIQEAQALFERHSIKSVRVDTSVPFHSRLMDEPVKILASTLPRELQRNRAGCQDNCIYVSGVTGRALNTAHIGPKYWLRHMREPVRFLKSMETVQARFEGSADGSGGVFIDVGPASTLKRIVNRYGWQGMETMDVEEYISRQAPGSSDVAHTRVIGTNAPDIRQTTRSFRRSEQLHGGGHVGSKTEVAAAVRRSFEATPRRSSLPKESWLFGETSVSTAGMATLPNGSASIVSSAQGQQKTYSGSKHHRQLTLPKMAREPLRINDVLDSAIKRGPPAGDSDVTVLTPSQRECAALLANLFAYSAPPTELLRGSFHTLGLDSLDFVRLSSALKDRLGATFAPSSYTSERSLMDLLAELPTTAETAT